MKVTANINSLLQKHNFVKGVVEYSVELSVLGTKVIVPVSEDFVQKLDAEAERSSRQQHENRVQAIRNKIRPKQQEEYDYSIADVDEDDYSSDNSEYEQA